ncbi:MAG: thioredoxin domain-containing protein [Vicinamibacterales bacterium]
MRVRRVFATVLLLASVLLAGRPLAQTLQPVTPEQRTELARWWAQQPLLNMPFDNNGSKVLIVEFTDLQCPHCRQKYLELKPVLDKYAARPREVTLVLKHWPIGTACNSGVTVNMHPAACDAAAAVVMARRKGTAEALIDWFFTHQEQMTPATVRQAALDVGKVTDFDAQLNRAIQEVKTDAALGSALGVNSTPSFFVNGRRLPGGGLAVHYFDAILDLELHSSK